MLTNEIVKNRTVESSVNYEKPSSPNQSHQHHGVNSGDSATVRSAVTMSSAGRHSI